MSLSLGGKTALVTGVTGHIGKAVVKGLVEAECYVIGTDRFPRYSVDDLFEELQLTWVQCIVIAVLADLETIEVISICNSCKAFWPDFCREFLIKFYPMNVLKNL